MLDELSAIRMNNIIDFQAKHHNRQNSVVEMTFQTTTIADRLLQSHALQCNANLAWNRNVKSLSFFLGGSDISLLAMSQYASDWSSYHSHRERFMHISACCQ